MTWTPAPPPPPEPPAAPHLWGARLAFSIGTIVALTVAARQLEADHTTVSRRISALEAALKAKLFERSPQGYTLTEQGERLLKHAETMETQALSVASELGGDG